MILGSEGNYGIITEAVLKIRKKPECIRYGSIIFPDFASGVDFMEEMARSKIWPASCRFVDNVQFLFGQALKIENDSTFANFFDQLKKFWVLTIKGFDPEKMCAVTLAFEGNEKDVNMQEEHTYRVGAKYKGMNAGEENGLRGYFLTFMIAYLRDFTLNFNFIAESIETSVPWAKIRTLCDETRKHFLQSCARRGYDENKVFMSFRIT